MQPGQQPYNNQNLNQPDLGPQPAQQTVIFQTAPYSNNTNKYVSYKSNQSLGLGITQLLIGVLCMILNIAGIVLQLEGWHIIFYFGYGFWIGIFFILAGSFGIGAKSKGKCLVITFMVMSIISSVMVWFMIGFAAAGIGIISAPQYDSFSYGYERNNSLPNIQGLLTMHSVMLVLSLIEFVVSIWSSAICCSAACCCNKQQGTVLSGPTVNYMQNQQGFIPQQQYQHNTPVGYPNQAYQGQPVVQPPPYNPASQPQEGQVPQPGYSPESGYTPLTDVRDLPPK